ncbi:MAG: iron ABC transporter permease [Paludibacteraceae bacterium]|nr:iron ABC transporter permease [Paludibacteraceae bacterium]
MNKLRTSLFFIVSAILLFLLFFADILWGSVRIPIEEVFLQDSIYANIINNFRLPKAITAVVVGMSVAVSGLLMQTLFRNPLAGPYVLGVSSGASFGVAIYILVGGFLPVVFLQSGWGLIISAVVGAIFVLILVLSVSFRIHDSITLLIVGMMFGQIAGSLVSVLQNISNPDSLKLFVVWTFGDLSAVTWSYMKAMIPIVLVGLVIVFLIQKPLNTLLLGENYAKSLGVSVVKVRLLIIVATALLAGGVTAFTGPIAFVGVAVPHLVRLLWKTSDHKITIPACLLVGANLLLVCDLLSQTTLNGYVLPINAISSLVGAPIIIWIIMRNR